MFGIYMIGMLLSIYNYVILGDIDYVIFVLIILFVGSDRFLMYIKGCIYEYYVVYLFDMLRVNEKSF